ncbi:hypothetical protein [Embleya sp. MST-111070]|uniref:hypothetical protein n=1 Tax=Embleya sp. MST-111070 TaxID=3398231 RepID=UPI003F7393C5
MEGPQHLAAGSSRTPRALCARRPAAFERIRAGYWAVTEWWDVHVRYHELHRRLDAARADLGNLGVGARDFAAYADTLRTRIDPLLAEEAVRSDERTVR